MGTASYTRREGFAIPERYSEEFAERLASRVAAPFPSLVQEQVHDAVRGHAEQLLTEELEQLMKPVTPYVPLTAALALFLPLLAVCYVLSWVVLPVLWLVLVLLRAVGVTRIETETIEVERVVLR
jgi:ABC-type transport system involved in cytochrome bd biosynthesis fused ATPase/permease subunit